MKSPMNTENPTLEIEGLKKYYTQQTGWVASLLGRETYIKAVDDVSIEIYPGEVLGIVGESGSGKSTLGETTLMLEEPTDGDIYFQGENITKYSSSEIREFRQNAQIIFQDPYGSLNPRKTILQIVSEPLKNFNIAADDELKSRVTDILYDVGLRPPGEFLFAHPNQLSGGQRQRVAIARALILEPDLLIADEPMSMLDVSIQSQIMNILTRLQDKLDFAMMYISHDLSVVNLIADRVGVMYRGKIVESGGAKQVIRNPQHPYTQALIKSLPDLSKNRERMLLQEPIENSQEPTGCSFHPQCPESMECCEQATPALGDACDREVRCYLHHKQTEDGRDIETQCETEKISEQGTYANN